MPESRADVHFGGEWTLTTLDEDFFMAENGQGEDRLIMFIMSNLIIVVYFIVHAYSKQAKCYFLVLSRQNGSTCVHGVSE